MSEGANQEWRRGSCVTNERTNDDDDKQRPAPPADDRAD
jgi:hypothetical protein